MANVNNPFGLRACAHPSGKIKMAEYSIATGYGTNIFFGDLVEMSGTGTNVTKSAAGNADNIGVFQGCRYVDSTGSQKFSLFWPASTTATEIVAMVVTDPMTEFEVQCDTLAAGDIGALVDINVGTGSTITGISGLYADIGATTATINKTLRLMRLKPSPDNAYGAYAKAIVTIVEHVLRPNVAAVGGI